MAGVTPIPKDAHELQRVYERTYGPFAEASMVDQVLDLFTKNTSIEAVEVMATQQAGDAASFVLVTIEGAQSLADAITATQVCTESVDLELAEDGVLISPAIDPDWNIIPAGSRLGLNVTGTPSDLSGLLIKVRFSEHLLR